MITNFYNYLVSACGMWAPSYLTILIKYRFSAITYSSSCKLKSDWLILHIASSFKPLGGNRNNGYIPVSFCGVILHEKYGLVLVKPCSNFLLEKIVVHLVRSACLSCSPNLYSFFSYKRPLVHILSHLHPFHALPSHVLKIHYKTIHSSVHLPCSFFDENFVDNFFFVAKRAIWKSTHPFWFCNSVFGMIGKAMAMAPQNKKKQKNLI